MVNSPNSVPPAGSGDSHPVDPTEKKSKPVPGGFDTKSPHTFLHMTFTADQWNKLMNLLLKNMNDYINKTFQKMTEKMKKDWKRERGEED
jgi:hypothetical protein